jgi:hypothetical protein
MRAAICAFMAPTMSGAEAGPHPVPCGASWRPAAVALNLLQLVDAIVARWQTASLRSLAFAAIEELSLSRRRRQSRSETADQCPKRMDRAHDILSLKVIGLESDGRPTSQERLSRNRLAIFDQDQGRSTRRDAGASRSCTCFPDFASPLGQCSHSRLAYSGYISCPQTSASLF